MTALATYETIIALVRIALFYGAAVIAVVCVGDWAVRTRRINPFSRVARFFRGSIDPMLAPVERVVVRTGGLPASAPWWALVAYAVGGILLITLLQLIGNVLREAVFAIQEPSEAWRVLLSWAFALLEAALLVRVLSSWLPISPHSKWIRWSYVLTDWMIVPLSRIIPRVGMFDITPLVAWFVLRLAQGAFGIP